METIVVGAGVMGGLIAACFLARSYLLSLQQISPRIRRVSAERDGISLDLEAGPQPAHIRWIFVRSGNWLRAVRVKRAEVRNWDGVQVFADFGGSRLRLRAFAISGKHGLPEAFIRMRLENPPQQVRLILLGRLGRHGDLGGFALQSKIDVSAAPAPTVHARPQLRRSERSARLQASLRSLGESAVQVSTASTRPAEQQSGG